MPDKIEITIDVIIHATEDIKKFYDAFENIFNIDAGQFSIQSLSGHFDNPITMLNLKLRKKDANNFLEKFLEKLPKEDIDEIIDDLDELISSSGLHLRLDKQEFVQGRLSIKEKNAIKIRIYTPVYNKKEIIKSYLTILKRSN